METVPLVEDSRLIKIAHERSLIRAEYGVPPIGFSGARKLDFQR